MNPFERLFDVKITVRAFAYEGSNIGDEHKFIVLQCTRNYQPKPEYAHIVASHNVPTPPDDGTKEDEKFNVVDGKKLLKLIKTLTKVPRDEIDNLSETLQYIVRVYQDNKKFFKNADEIDDTTNYHQHYH